MFRDIKHLTPQKTHWNPHETRFFPFKLPLSDMNILILSLRFYFLFQGYEQQREKVNANQMFTVWGS